LSYIVLSNAKNQEADLAPPPMAEGPMPWHIWRYWPFVTYESGSEHDAPNHRTPGTPTLTLES